MTVRKRLLWRGVLTAALVVAVGAVAPSAATAAPLVIKPLEFTANWDATCGDRNFEIAELLDIRLQQLGLPKVTRVNEPVPGETGIVRHGIVEKVKMAFALVKAEGLTGNEAVDRLVELIDDIILLDLLATVELGTKYKGGRVEHADASGNLVQLWCLKKRPGVHGGPDFGLYYTGGGVTGWIGACVYIGGLNEWSFELDQGKFSKIRWINTKPNSDEGWAFTYDLSDKQNLRIDKLKVTDDTYESIDSETDTVPAQFKNIKFKDEGQITLNDAPAILTRPMAALGVAAPKLGAPWFVYDYGLAGGSTPLGAEALVRPGDRLTFVKAGIRTARVTDLAASQGWSVAGWSSQSATFQYDGAEPLPLEPFEGPAGLVVEADPTSLPPADGFDLDITDEKIAELADGAPPLPDLAHSATVAYELPPALTTSDLVIPVLGPRVIEPPLE